MAKLNMSETAKVMYEKAHHLLEEGDLEQALEQARLLLAEDDSNASFWCIEGQIRLALGEEQPAERAFDRACTLSPGNPEPLFHKANYHLVLEQFEEAIRLSEQALQYAEDDEDRYNSFLLLGEAQFGHAQSLIMEWFESVLEEEEYSTPQSARNQSLEQEKMPPLPPEIVTLLEKGLASTQKVLDINDQIAEGWDLQARYAQTMGNNEQAIESWKHAVDLAPYEPLFLHSLATAYQEAGEHEEAYKTFRELYEWEMENDDEGMEFSRKEFQEIAQRVCQDLEAEVHEHFDTPIVFQVKVEDFPEESYLEQAPNQHPFDPWIPCIVTSGPTSETHESIEFILFQKNIEREAFTDDSHELYHFLFDLLQQLLLEVANFDENESIEA